MARKSTKARKAEPEINLAVFSNEPTPMDYNMLEMFYNGAFSGQIGLMHAKHEESGDIHRLIVGTEWNQETNKLDTYPLARLIEPDQMNGYLAPDGKGGYE